MHTPISNHHERVGLAIQEYRNEHKLSIHAFARLCSIRVDVLERMERGEVNFRLTTMVKLINVMGKVPFA